MTRSPSTLPLSVLILGLALSAVLAACADRSAPRFPHRMHLAELDCGKPGKPDCLSCNSCHAVSERDRAHKLPQPDLCANCHRSDAHAVRAVFATDPPRASGPIHFEHDLHLKMKEIKGQCVPCHAGVIEPRTSTLPPMAKCFSCHEHAEEWKQGVCAPCHVQADLERTLPQTFLRHDQNFAHQHGQFARQEQRLCQACHSQAQCDDCHDISQTLPVEKRMPEKIERRFVHRADFVVRHAIEAESQPVRCQRCHTAESCDACHVARGVSANRLGAANPHPPGWVGTNPNTRTFHGREARRDILACAACHDQGPATNCIRCHKVGGFGGNPHPGGWKSSQSTSAEMCRYCHE